MRIYRGAWPLFKYRIDPASALARTEARHVARDAKEARADAEAERHRTPAEREATWQKVLVSEREHKARLERERIERDAEWDAARAAERAAKEPV
jgi:hypothetical protein